MKGGIPNVAVIVFRLLNLFQNISLTATTMTKYYSKAAISFKKFLLLLK